MGIDKDILSLSLKYNIVGVVWVWEVESGRVGGGETCIYPKPVRQFHPLVTQVE